MQTLSRGEALTLQLYLKKADFFHSIMLRESTYNQTCWSSATGLPQIIALSKPKGDSGCVNQLETVLLRSVEQKNTLFTKVGVFQT